MIIICYGFSVRFIQALVEASLTWVVGLLTAGILRRMVGPAGTRPSVTPSCLRAKQIYRKAV